MDLPTEELSPAPGGLARDSLIPAGLHAEELASALTTISALTQTFRPTTRLSVLPRPICDHYATGRALACDGDVLGGRYQRGMSVLVAPGETIRLGDGQVDYRFVWRVAVHYALSAQPLDTPPELFEDRSLSWIVDLVCRRGHQLVRRSRGTDHEKTVEDQVMRSVAWVARASREVIRWHLTRLTPHLDRQPHPWVIAETRPLLREYVLDAATVFGQEWVADVMGSSGHLVAEHGAPDDLYVQSGHDAFQRYLQAREVDGGHV